MVISVIRNRMKRVIVGEKCGKKKRFSAGSSYGKSKIKRCKLTTYVIVMKLVEQALITYFEQ